jgi:hypothetical protein
MTPKNNTLATTYVIIAGRFTIKLEMIGYIVRIVDDTSKDQHALISTTRRRMVNDSVEMLSRYHMYLISYQESLKRFYIFDSALM